MPGAGQRRLWPIANPGQTSGDDADQLGAFRLVRDEIREHVLTELLAERTP